MNNRVCWIMALALAALANDSLAAEPARHWADDATLSPEVVIDKDGTVRLAHSVLLADETGATDFHQTETLSERVQARKVFRLDSADVTSAELFVFGSAKQIRVNGKPLDKSERLVSTGWTRAKVPPELLKAGDNEVVLSGGGSLLIEPGGRLGRSFKSADGGKTWSAHTLGKNGDLQGEYLVRLRLGRYAPRGVILDGVVDVWEGKPGQVAVPRELTWFGLRAELDKGQPEGTRIAVWLRTGSTPTPDPKTWTDWTRLGKLVRIKGLAVEFEGLAVKHRWVQLKFELQTDHPQATPRMPRELQISYNTRLLLDTESDKDKLEVVAPAKGVVPILQGSTPFVYQEPSPRLKLLRERYELDKVIAPGKTEMEQLMLLRHWVRNQWHTAWGGDSASWMPPWDAHIILESKDQSDCLTMCTHYAAVFTQCCAALGWNSRHCILDHHCVAEVFVNQHNKWVMMDAGNSKERPDCNLHFERKGIPLSALELHLAHKNGKTDDITVCFTPARLMEKITDRVRKAPEPKKKPEPRPDTVPVSELGKYPVCGLENYRRYAFPGRNNYLSSLLPGELYQGWSEYFYDGYLWVGDSHDDPKVSPEYSRHLSPARPQDIDWNLNWTRIHLARTQKPGELQVDLETFTPNLGRLEMATADSWKPTAASFVWKLEPGKNVLRVRSVNKFERPGVESQVQVNWDPKAH